MIGTFILAISFAGIIMLFDYSTWDGNILERVYLLLRMLPPFIGKPLGLCQPCLCFWSSCIFAMIRYGVAINSLIFIGTSCLIVIFYKLFIMSKFG